MSTKKDAVRERVMMHFAEEMQEALDKKGWKRSRLKAETGVSVDRYNNDDDGREPTLSSAVRIADALEISLDQLCGRTEFARDMDNLNAGECIELILILLHQLGGNISDNGDYSIITFPPSTVTNVLGKMLEHKAEYASYYEGAMRFAPESKPKSVYDETMTFIGKRVEELKERNEPIGIELFGSDQFEAFDGTVYLGHDCIEGPEQSEDIFTDATAREE